MPLAVENDECHSGRTDVESRNPVAVRKADFLGSFDFAQDDVAWKLVKLKNE